MDFVIQRLETAHRVQDFDCQDAALTTYLRRYALKNQTRLHVGVTYVGLSGPAQNVILGYYTLAAASIPRLAFTDQHYEGLSPYADVPCILLARLAVDRRFQRRGLGKILLRNALERCLLIGGEIGARCVLVDAYRSAVPWYARFGFISVSAAAGASQKLFIDLRTVAAAKELK
jgi:GNAT superfamily N-acetyltransferase